MYFFSLYQDSSFSNIAVDTCVFAIELFGMLILLEIVEIRACGMSHNIGNEINKRQQEEFDSKAKGLFPIDEYSEF